MRVQEILSNTTAKRADDYSEEELFRLHGKMGKSSKEAAETIVVEEIKEKNLVSSAEEGMKLMKLLLNFKTVAV